MEVLTSGRYRAQLIHDESSHSLEAGQFFFGQFIHIKQFF